MSFKKNQLVELYITDISAEGHGVGHLEGMVVFVPLSAPGDVLEVLLVKVNKNHAYGKIIKVQTPSADRIQNSCPVYGKCGGCAFRHMSYAAELKAKLNIAANAVKRIGGSDIIPEVIIPSPFIEGYRNKAVLPFGIVNGEIKLGFYAGRSHRLVAVKNCALCPKEFADIQKTALGFMQERNISVYDETTGKGLLRHMYLRRGEHDGEICLCFVINGDGIPGEKELAEIMTRKFPKITGVLVNVHKGRGNANIGESFRLVQGRAHINDGICGMKIRINPRSFYQVNTGAAELMLQTAFEMISIPPAEKVLDLFCGAGTIGLFFAKNRPDIQVMGIEIEAQAVADAEENAKINGLTNIRFTEADLSASDSLPGLLEGSGTIFLDPPRKGLDSVTAAAIAKSRPRQILYISCDPATFARDLRFLGQHGYKLTKIKAVDIFPRTKHVEAVVLLQRHDS